MGDLVPDDVLHSRVWCWKCMENTVKRAGDVCIVCSASDAVFHRQTGERTEWMSLDQLERTQQSGWVPEDNDYHEHETPIDPDWV